jgi:hypothetical protein
MGKKSRESMRGVSEVKNANSVKLVADEAVVDPTLAALFATSVGSNQFDTYSGSCADLSRLAQ